MAAGIRPKSHMNATMYQFRPLTTNARNAVTADIQRGLSIGFKHRITHALTYQQTCDDEIYKGIAVVEECTAASVGMSE